MHRNYVFYTPQGELYAHERLLEIHCAIAVPYALLRARIKEQELERRALLKVLGSSRLEESHSRSLQEDRLQKSEDSLSVANAFPRA